MKDFGDKFMEPEFFWSQSCDLEYDRSYRFRLPQMVQHSLYQLILLRAMQNDPKAYFAAAYNHPKQPLICHIGIPSISSTVK